MVWSCSFFNLLIFLSVYHDYGAAEFICGNEADADTTLIDICSSTTVTNSNSSRPILLRVSNTTECKCLFTIQNQIGAILFNIGRWNNLASSTPSSDKSCGVQLDFRISNTDFFVLRCGTISFWNYWLNTSHHMSVQTIKIDGQLKENEGYCIEFFVKALPEGQYAQLQCGNQSETSTQMTDKTTENQELELSSTIEWASSVIHTTNRDTETEPLSKPTTQAVTSLQEQKTIRINNTSMNTAIGASVGGIVFIIVVVVVIVIFKRRRQNKEHRNPRSMNEEDDSALGNDGLLYNVLYQPTVNDTNINADDNHQQESQVNYVPVEYDGNYSAVDPDCFETPPTTAENDLQNGKIKPKIAKKPTHLQRKTKSEECSNGDELVKRISVPGNDSCEYAIVDKKNDIKRSQRPSSTVNYTTASGDVYAAVQKSKTLPASTKQEGQGIKM